MRNEIALAGQILPPGNLRTRAGSFSKLQHIETIRLK
jgi:hypothetical protein